MAKIRKLPPEIVHRIAAGEVIERPSSVVKELVENAIDADATEVLVDLEEGGTKRITVQDNGSGMDADDLPLAFESHATSKLTEGNAQGGLFGIVTLGFRGEALPSIASVADVEVLSRRHRAEHAHRFVPGRGAPEPAPGEPGTVVEVRHLFHNVPARRKFLRAGGTELSRVLRQVERVALAYPSIRFLVTSGGKRLLDLAPCDTLRERVLQTVGGGRSSELIEIRSAGSESAPTIHGFASAPSWRRGDSRQQHFFVNGRWVKDRTLSAAFRAAYQGFLIPGNHPIGWIFLDFPPEAVDVNVHPTKSEVRFRDSGRVFPLLRDAVRAALAESRVGRVSYAGSSASPGSAAGDARGDAEARPAEGGAEKVRQAALELLETKGEAPTTSVGPPDAPPPRREARPGPSSPSGPPPVSRLFGPSMRPGASAAPSVPQPADESERRGGAVAGAGRGAFQILDSFIVVDDGDGVLVVDQHALHEKILFEEIYRRVSGGGLVQQRLMVPEVVSIDAEHVPLIEESRALFARCGYEVEAFGDREVAVHAVPEILEKRVGRSATSAIVRSVLAWILEAGERASATEGAPEEVERRLRALASLMACKRAVKAGMRLAAEEIASLLEKGDLADDPRNCPHGRPTTVRLDRRELERMFDRK